MNVSAATRSNCHMAAACVHVARLSLGNRARPLGGSDLIPCRTANPNARGTRPAARRQAGAVEARTPCRATPHIGHAELALRSSHDRAAVIVRTAARRGIAARRRAAAVVGSVVVRSAAVARGVIARSTTVGCRVIRAAIIARGVISSFSLRGGRSSLFRRFLSSSLFLGKQLGNLRIERIDLVLVLLHKLFSLLLRRIGLFDLLLGDIGLVGIFLLLGLVVGAKILSLLDHLGIFFIQRGERIPVLREIVERIRTQNNVEERGLAIAVHIAGALGKLILQLVDLRVVIVDFSLALVHLGDCLVVLLHGLVVIRGCSTELLAHRIQLLTSFVSLSLHIGRRRIGEGILRRNHGRGAKGGGSTEEGSSRQACV